MKYFAKNMQTEKILYFQNQQEDSVFVYADKVRIKNPEVAVEIFGTFKHLIR